jgi:hypothetical protein
MGITVFSGMLAATLLAIFFVPVLYVTVERLVARFGGKRRAVGATTALPAGAGNEASK